MSDEERSEIDFPRRRLLAAAGVLAASALFARESQGVLPLPAGYVAFTSASTVFKNISQGAAAFKSLFDNPGFDIQKLLHEVIEEVRAAVKFEILKDAQRKLEATGNGLQILMQDYVNAPNQLLLNGLHEKTVLAVSEAESLKVGGIPTYGLLGTLMLSVYQEQYLRNRARGQRRNLENGARRLVRAVDVFRNDLREHTENRFTKGWGPLVMPPLQYILDGKPVPLGAEPRNAEARFRFVKDEEFNKSEGEVMSNLYRLRDEWKTIGRA